MIRPIVIVGAGGHARDVLCVVDAMNSVEPSWRVLGLVADPGPDGGHAERCSYPCLGNVEVLREIDCDVVIGIGNGSVRRRLDDLISSWGHEFATLCHPSATIGAYVELGAGTVLCAGARVTTNVRTGRHVHINLNSTVAHDCRLADYVTINPLAAVSGNVTIGTETMVGTGAAIIEGRRIGDRCVIGAGAVVIRDSPDDQTLIGVPARSLNSS